MCSVSALSLSLIRGEPRYVCAWPPWFLSLRLLAQCTFFLRVPLAAKFIGFVKPFSQSCELNLTWTLTDCTCCGEEFDVHLVTVFVLCVLARTFRHHHLSSNSQDVCPRKRLTCSGWCVERPECQTVASLLATLAGSTTSGAWASAFRGGAVARCRVESDEVRSPRRPV